MCGFKLLAATLLLSMFALQSVHSDEPSPSLFSQLDLNSTQKSAIQSVLMGGMQSLQAINNELGGLTSTDAYDIAAVEQMRAALQIQRVDLAESMVMEILDVLSEEQIAKFNFGALADALPTGSREAESSVREFEI